MIGIEVDKMAIVLCSDALTGTGTGTALASPVAVLNAVVARTHALHPWHATVPKLETQLYAEVRAHTQAT